MIIPGLQPRMSRFSTMKYCKPKHINSFNKLRVRDMDKKMADLSNKYAKYWQERVQNKPKLRTYSTFTTEP